MLPDSVLQRTSYTYSRHWMLSARTRSSKSCILLRRLWIAEAIIHLFLTLQNLSLPHSQATCVAACPGAVDIPFNMELCNLAATKGAL